MKELAKEDFIKLCKGSTSDEGISSIYIPEIVRALEDAAQGEPTIIWIQGAACTGCMVTLLDSVHAKIRKSLIKIVNHTYPGTSALPGGRVEHIYNLAREKQGAFILVVEGAVPLGADGMYCRMGEDAQGKTVTLKDMVCQLGSMAKAVLAVGSCAVYGGASAARPNPTGCVGLSRALFDKMVINVPGCPPRPDRIIGTLCHTLLYGDPDLDGKGRPLLFYPEIKISGDRLGRRRRRKLFAGGVLAITGER